jgi:hypothetical protein
MIAAIHYQFFIEKFLKSFFKVSFFKKAFKKVKYDVFFLALKMLLV